MSTGSVEDIHRSLGKGGEPSDQDLQYGLGALGDVGQTDSNPVQVRRDGAVNPELGGMDTITIAGITCRKPTMSDMAALQEVKSVFVDFTPLLTSVERKKYQSYAGIVKAGGRLKPKDQETFQKLHDKMLQEQAQVGNPFLEVLIFFAVMNVNTTPEKATELAWGERKDLIKEAMRVGSGIKADSWEEIGKTISDTLADQFDTKVTPKPSNDRKRKKVPLGK